MQKWAAQLRSCRHWSEDQARDVLHRQQASGDALATFARRMGFVPQRLAWWRDRLGNIESERQANVRTAPLFLPVTVRDAQVASPGRTALMVVRVGRDVEVDVHQADATTAAWVALLAVECAAGETS